MKIRNIIKLLKADGWYLVASKGSHQQYKHPTMYRFLIVIEKANNNYSVYSPDLPGCVATGDTREEAEKNMYEAIEMHIEGLLEDKLPIPKSKSFAEYVAVAEKSCIEQTV
jgi:predicted RNase H-like HicB family nuclease